MATIIDRRKDKSKPWAFVIMTDSFLSGWGEACGGRSLYALAVNGPQEAQIVIDNAKHRTEMKRPRLTQNPKRRLAAKDHLVIADRDDADRFYTPGGFAG